MDISRGIKVITFKQELSKPQIFWQTQLKLFETKLGVCFPPPVIRTNNGCDGTRCYSYYFSQRIQQVQEEPTTAQNTAWISFESELQIFQWQELFTVPCNGNMNNIVHDPELFCRLQATYCIFTQPNTTVSRQSLWIATTVTMQPKSNSCAYEDILVCIEFAKLMFSSDPWRVFVIKQPFCQTFPLWILTTLSAHFIISCYPTRAA